MIVNMIPIEISERVYLLKSNHWDRKLFDEIIPLPEGTTYNSYLVIGDKKTALIDTVDFSKEKELIECLSTMNVNIDYIVCNHAEQDHSGAIPKVLEMYPSSKVITNEKCKEFLMDLLLIPEDRFITINSGQEISLGDKTLRFISMPWVHWPETMVTFLIEDKILFTCDLFGSHYASSSVFVKDERKEYLAAKIYYAEIMMPFRRLISKYLTEIRNLNPRIIAPSHGSLYKNVDFILDAYQDWTSDDVKDLVIVLFVSMHGSIKKVVDYLVDKLMEKGIDVRYYNVTECDVGNVAMDLVDASTLILATPTFLSGPHPKILDIAYLISLLRPKLRYVSYITSYNWSSRAIEILKNIMSGINAEILSEIRIKGYPRSEDFKMLDDLVIKVCNRHAQHRSKGGESSGE